LERVYTSSRKTPLCHNTDQHILERVHLKTPFQSILILYDNISKLQFQQGPNGETLATAMISAEGEIMEFRKHVPAEGRVEEWMTAILDEMRSTNRIIAVARVSPFGPCWNCSLEMLSYI
jgi:hypothetical protein